MQQKDFIELIDLKAEYKEYIRFYSGKSEKYQTFADWDAHIESLLDNIDTSSDLYNLQRYCAHRVRTGEDTSLIFWGYLGLAFPVVLTFSTESERVGLKGIVSMVFILGFLLYITITSKRNAREKHFYEDMLRIINQIDTK